MTVEDLMRRFEGSELRDHSIQEPSHPPSNPNEITLEEVDLVGMERASQLAGANQLTFNLEKVRIFKKPSEEDTKLRTMSHI